MTLFEDDGGYAAFERVLAQACARVSIRLLAYCVMPNNWHLIVWPRQDGDLSRFMNWLTLTHAHRWHQHRHSVGEGHVFQGRFKSFPVETSEYLLMKRLADWPDWVNKGEPTEQLSTVRRSVTKGQPLGRPTWVEQMMVAQWNLGPTLRKPGRPNKELVNNGS